MSLTVLVVLSVVVVLAVVTVAGYAIDRSVPESAEDAGEARDRDVPLVR